MKNLVTGCLLVLLSNTAMAEKDVDLPAVIATRGELVFEDDFSGAKLQDDWQQVRGEWKISEGAVVGKEVKADKHAAVFHCLKKNRNSVVRFSFRLDGADQFHFSLNYQRGHLFRTIVTPDSVTVRTDHSKRDKSIRSEMLGKAAATFQPGKWYTMQIEMVGDRVAVTTDNGVKIEGQHARLDTEKPNYRFILKSQYLALDDIRVWNAQ